MVIAGEPSGDALAADLIKALRQARPGQIRSRVFGLGGPKLAAQGVELIEDMTQKTVFGFFEALRQYRHFKAIFDRAVHRAIQRQPDLIILVDFGGFNLRFAKAIRRYEAQSRNEFSNWKPKLVYYVPPQVWASREGRATTLARNIDHLVSILPFEQEWYQRRYPKLSLEFVGDPMATKYHNSLKPTPVAPSREARPRFTLLPGSRQQEVRRHLPLMLEAMERIQEHRDCETTIVVPSNELAQHVQEWAPSHMRCQVGQLEDALRQTDVAIAASGTVTRECAYLRVPTVVIYTLSRLTYEIGKRIVKVRFIAMPNLLADEMVFPELIQDAANPISIAQEALQLLMFEDRKRVIETLDRVMPSLGPPGASQRAAQSILKHCPLV